MRKVLIVTNEDDPHADKVIDHLGENVFRINTEKILGDFNINISIYNGHNNSFISGYNRKILQNDISSVYYRRPVKPLDEVSSFDSVRIGEAWGALYHFLHSLSNIPWMGHPLNDKKNSSRLLQLDTAVSSGFNVPETLISKNIGEIKRFVSKNGKIAVKPIHVRGFNDDKFWTPYFTEVIDKKELFKVDTEVISSTYNYIQKYINKKREWRITVVGNKIFPCVIESQKSIGAELDWRKKKYEHIKHYYEKIPNQVSDKILDYINKLDLPFGAIDLIETPEEEWYFLECNPNGQWLWIEELTNQPISKAIADWHLSYL